MSWCPVSKGGGERGIFPARDRPGAVTWKGKAMRTTWLQPLVAALATAGVVAATTLLVALVVFSGLTPHKAKGRHYI